MQPVVMFADFEAWATDWLRAQLMIRPEAYAADVFVATEVPETRLDRMVILRRDGGPRLDVARELVRLGIRVWGEDDEVANDLAQLVRALLAATPGEGPVRRYTEIAGPVTIDDGTPQPQRFMTAEFIARSL